MFGLEFGQLLILSEIDAGSEILQVPDPPSAAPSTGFLVHLEADSRQADGRALDDGGRRS